MIDTKWIGYELPYSVLPIERGRLRYTVRAVRDAGSEAVACVGNVAATDFVERFIGVAVTECRGLDIVVSNGETLLCSGGISGI